MDMLAPQPANAKTKNVAHAALLIAVSIALLLPVSACSSSVPYVTTVGALAPATTMHVAVANATVNVYAPEVSQRKNLFTIAATALPKGTPPPPPLVRPVRGGIEVDAVNPLASLLVRVPDRSDIVVRSRRGDISVTDIGGNADVATANGNVTLMLNGYAQASAGNGTLNVTMGALAWPGTLRFSTQRGDITLWISPRAACTVHLHTAAGTLFTDFGLTGVANGSSETIDGALDGGGTQRIEVDAGRGSIRLLRLQPQA
jgi:hypothetical protein